MKKLTFRALIGAAFILVALLLLPALAAPVPVNAKAEWRMVLAGQGTGFIIQQMDSTTGTKCFEAQDNSGTSVWNVTRDGNETTTGAITAGTTISGQQILPVSSVQSLAAGATLTPPTGKSLIQVAGSGAARTLSTTTPIAAGTTAGTVIVLEGTDDTNTVTVPVNGTSNIKGANGQTTRVLGNFDLLTLVWDGTAWVERSFSNNT